MDWRSVKQTAVAISTVEAKYVALSKVCTMILYFRHLMETINDIQKKATIIFEDNSGEVAALSRSNKITPRTKHIDVINFPHVRSLVADNVVDVTYIETELQKAETLTKNLGAVKFLKNRLLLLGV